MASGGSSSGRHVLRNPDIARFLGWCALTSASEGIVVLALSVHLVLGVGPTAVGLLAFRVLPAACLGAFASWPASRWPAYRVLNAIAVARATLLGLMAVALAVGGSGSLVVVLLLAAIEATIATGARPAQLVVQVGVARSPAELTLRDSPQVFRARGECTPGWRSPPRRFPLPARQRRPRRHDDARVSVIELLRTASASAPAGPVTIAALAETDMARNLGLTVAVLRDLLSRRFGGTPSAWREALGERDAVALGRAAPRSAGDWAVLVTKLIELGFEFDRGWQQRWDKLSRTSCLWLPREATLRAAERSLGFQFFDLVERVRTEGDGPVRRRRPTFWRPSDFEDCLRAIVETDRTTPTGRLRFADLAAATAGDPALPDLATIKYRIYDRGLTLELAVRAALGIERALRRQRVRPASREEWAMVIGWAIDAGLDVDRPWGSWPEVMRRTDFLPDRHVLYEWLGKRGFSGFVWEIADVGG